jgi:CBS domain containing-hemolysin-like protein
MIFWAILLLLYYLALYSERQLVRGIPAVSEKTASGTNLHKYVQDVGPSLATLMVLRVILTVSLGVVSFSFLWTHPVVRAWVAVVAADRIWQAYLFWTVVVLVLAAMLAGLLWVLRLWALPTVKALGFAHAYAHFWRKILKPFVRSKGTWGGQDRMSGQDESAGVGVNTDSSDLALMKSIAKFGDVTIKKVMQPRSKVVGTDFRATFHALLELVREAGFSRMPVFVDDLDNVVGMLYVKDLVAHLDREEGFEWQSLVRTDYLQVPESKPIHDLLDEFKRKKVHMAVVVDEYGGTSGIVTMEDVLEEVIGEIRDEFDEESEVRYRKLDEFNYIFEAQTLLHDVCRIVGRPEDFFDDMRGSADTIAGLVLELNGDIPSSGQEVQWGDVVFKVLSADNRRIKQIRITFPDTPS